MHVETLSTNERRIHAGFAAGCVVALAFGLYGTAGYHPEVDLSLPEIEMPIVERVMEWRPQGPPPWMDVDQFTQDEVEESPAVAGDDVAAPRGGGEAGDLRQRPER